MAVVRDGNVISISADADTISGNFRVKSIKYKAGTSASMKKTNTSGNVLWQHVGTADVLDSEVCIRLTGTTYFTIAGSAVLYLYLE